MGSIFSRRARRADRQRFGPVRPPLPGAFPLLLTGAVALSFANVPGQNLSFANSRNEREPTRGRAIDHIGFEVDNLEAFTQMLEARGITLDVPYQVLPSIELAIAFLTDPSGVRIELTEGFDEY